MQFEGFGEIMHIKQFFERLELLGAYKKTVFDPYTTQ